MVGLVVFDLGASSFPEDFKLNVELDSAAELREFEVDLVLGLVNIEFNCRLGFVSRIILVSSVYLLLICLFSHISILYIVTWSKLLRFRMLSF